MFLCFLSLPDIDIIVSYLILAPYSVFSSSQDYIRSSLVWSMLKQMLSDDRNEAVREAVTKSLALVVAFIENVDKYEQVIPLNYF